MRLPREYHHFYRLVEGWRRLLNLLCNHLDFFFRLSLDIECGAILSKYHSMIVTTRLEFDGNVLAMARTLMSTFQSCTWLAD